MPFTKRNSTLENRILDEMIQSSPEAKAAHEVFMKEYMLRKALVEARNQAGLTQKELSEATGLTQQAISRVETGSSGTTLHNLVRYLNGIGYELILQKTAE